MAKAVEVIEPPQRAGLIAFRTSAIAGCAEHLPALRSGWRLRAAAFVAGLGTLTRGLAADRGVSWESTIEPSELAFQGDPELLEQAVLNLLKNALQAVAAQPDGRVRLICGRENGAAFITVVDNGPGLTPAQAEAAFAPFFTTKPGGSGIGLSLARQIALAHGGRLEHLTPARGGAAFRLLLPEAAGATP